MCTDHGQGEFEPATPAQKKIKTIWKKYHLKEITEDQYDSIIKAVEQLEKEQEKVKNKITINDYDKLKEKFTDRQIAIGIILDLTEEEMEKDVDEYEAEGRSIEVQGRSYCFGTDDEMNDEWVESIENAMDDYLPETMKKYGRSDVSIEDGVVTASMSIEFSDRSDELSRYDGEELSQEVNGVWYYMYRQD